MKILFLNPSYWNNFSGRAHDYFIKAVDKQTDCKLAGIGWRDSGEGVNSELWEKARLRLEKVLPTPDWQKVYSSGRRNLQHAMIYHIMRLYGDQEPDWVIEGYVHAREVGMKYKLCRWVGDIHVNTDFIADVTNKELDLLPMFCDKTKYIFDNLEKFYAYCRNISIEKSIKDGEMRQVEEDYFTKQLKTPWVFFPISVEPTVFHTLPEKIYDISMIATVGEKFYPLRYNIYLGLQEWINQGKYKILLKTPPDMNNVNYRHDVRLIQNDKSLREKWLVTEDYAKAIAQSKIFMFCSSIFRYPVTKFIEGMMSGAMVMADEPFRAEECHFKDGFNYVTIDKDNWRQKVEYYLTHDKEREEIAKNGYETAMKYHTTDVRAAEFIVTLEKYKNAN